MIQLDDDSIITLTDDEGNEVDFLLLDVVEYNGGDFLVLLPLEEEADDEEDNVLILKAEKDAEGNETFASIDDENVVNAVFELFTEQLEAAAEAEGIDDEDDEPTEAE